MPNKLTPANFKTIGVCALIAAASLVIGLKYFSRAFPEAAIEFRVNREDSQPFAQKFLEGRGIRVEGYHHVAVFSYDDSAKVYMERTLGLDRMNELTRGPVHLWRWTHRWFKPQQQEEFAVSVTPTGQVVGFRHTIPEAAPGATLDGPAAQALAEKFLVEVMGRNLGSLEFVEGKDYQRPARGDHDFTWKQKNVDLGEGQWRIEVDVAGDQVSGYHEFVKIPDQWSRDYSRLRSRNDVAQQAAEVLFALLTIAMIVILVRRLRDRDVPLKLAFVLGGVGAALYFLGQLNNFPMAVFGYPTTDSYSSFFANYLRNSVLAALGVATWIFILTASAEPVYRAAYPSLPSLRRGLGWQGVRSRSFFINNVVGITLTCFFFAYQTVFYLAAGKLGAWSPAEVNYSDLLSTKIPWVWVLFIGFLPAVSEELQFRAFAIPFLQRIFRHKAVAVVLAAFIWGFLHSNYPSQPFFIRGIEVGLGGIIIGLVMLRFGVIGTLIWHYSVDAIYTAFLLLRSSDSYLLVSGAITAGIMLVPLVVSLIAYLRVGTFSDDSALTNESVGTLRAPASEAAAETPRPLVYDPLNRSRLILGGALIAIFLALALLPVERFGKDTPVATTRREALRLADESLRQRGVDPASYRSLAWPSVNVDYSAVKYIQQRRTIAETERIYRQATQLLVWPVRYFRPLEKQEQWVYVDATEPRVISYGQVVAEDAPGASLSLEEAQKRAEEVLVQRGYHLEDFVLKEKLDTKRKARVDWMFEWEVKPGGPGAALTVDDAHFRVRVDLAGDQFVGLSRFFKLPEEWEREQSARTLANVLLYGCSSLLAMLVTGGLLILFVHQVRAGAIRWRAAAKVAGVALAAIVLAELNQFPQITQSYDTSKSMSTFWFQTLATNIVGPVAAALGIWVLVGFAASLFPDCWRVFQGPARRIWRRDAALAIVVLLAVSFGTGRLTSFFFSRFHEVAPVRIDINADLLGSWLPGAGFFIRGLIYALVLAATAALVMYFVELGLKTRRWWIWMSAALLLVSLGPSGAHSSGEFLVAWTASAARLLVTIAVVALFFRNNVAAYLGAAFCVIVASPLISLLGQPAAFFKWNGALLGVGTAGFLAWLLWGTGEQAVESESVPEVS
ncbi:MAG: CPBP family intramembrane metalloprotease [Acidobacteria bacterium]|nr:CPBP family intramembrane metalloprotease [Acidobacteriota bacterium]